MTRILVITNLYPPLWQGGYEGLCEAAVDYLRAAGHTVRVLTSDLRDGAPGEGQDGPDVHRHLPIYWQDHRPTRPSLAKRWAAERRSRTILTEHVQEFRPDVVSVWNHAALSFGTLGYLRRWGVPVVAVIGDRWLTFGPHADAWSRMFVRRGRAGRVAAQVVGRVTGLETIPHTHQDVTVLFGSEYLADVTARTSPFEFSRTAVVPHGVDLDAFPPVPIDDPDERAWRGRLLVVARLSPEKGVATAIRAAARMADVTLDIAGPGDPGHMRALERLVGDLDLADRVRFLGSCDRPTVRRLYLDADALLFPSEWDEPFGIVPLEAMASGTPVIGTGTGGSGAFLRHEETCLRYPAGDVEALAAAIHRLATDAHLRGRLRLAGAQTAAAFSQQRTFESLEAWHVAAADGYRDGEPGS